jgi:hypothetical protein
MKDYTHVCLGLICALFFAGCTGIQEGMINGTVNISGAVYGSNLREYTLEAARLDDPNHWTTVGIYVSGETGSRLDDTVLAGWNTSKVADGKYVIRLTATGSNGEKSTDYLYVTVNNNPETSACPAWSCGGLSMGGNNVSINLTQSEYKNNMNCSVLCECPAGTHTEIYSNGNTEESYDLVTLTGNTSEDEYQLSGNWSDDSPVYFSENDGVEISFTSDYSNDGSSGYRGFDVPEIRCIPYCRSESGYSAYEYIAKIKVNNESSVSGNGSRTDYTGTVLTSLVAGQNYTLEVNIRSANEKDCVEKAVAWIDYDGDYVFNDTIENAGVPAERIDLGNYTMQRGTHKFSADFTVPNDAGNGQTRMRIALRGCPKEECTDENESYCEEYMKTPEPEPCDYDESFGEVEDYAVAVTRSGCGLLGDEPPCGEVTLGEVLNVIRLWQKEEASLGDVLSLINAWESQV